MITKNEIKQKIRENSNVLKEFNVSRIGLFGSFAKGNAAEKSDIDLLVDFSQTISLFRYVHLSDSISGFLHHRVDLVEVSSIKPLIKESILNEVEWIEGL